MVRPASTDTILGGRVLLRQPAQGYRTAIDPVLLAAAVNPRPGETVLDAGCGTGAASLCLAARIEGAEIIGIDAEPEFIGLARESAGLNGFQPAPVFAIADLNQYGRAAGFDHVMTNPPFRTAASGQAPAHPLKRAANVEGRLSLAEWTGRCFQLLQPGGCFTMIHSQDRLSEVRALVKERARDAVIHPLWPKRRGRGAKRFIVQAIKPEAGEAAGIEAVRLSEGLVLHRADGTYTVAAERILSAAEPLRFNFP